MHKESVGKNTNHRHHQLLNHEKETHKILLQCDNCANPLYVNFRYDEICMAYNQFKNKGLDLLKLFKFQQKVDSVVYPWNAEYNTLRFGVNKLINVFPLIIVMAKTEEDIILAFRFARKYKIEVSMRGGSHSFQGFSLCEGMIIDQSRRLGITYDREKNLVKCEPGVLLGPLIDYLSKYKTSVVMGGCLNNGTIGFTLGGGIGALTRMHGVNSDNIVEAKILLANGDIKTINDKNNSDLFWAIRGAGIGNFGIVLSLTMKTHYINLVWSYNIKYDFNKTKEIIKIWQNWTNEVPDELNSNIVVHRDSCILYGIYVGSSKRKLLELLKPFTIIKSLSEEIIRKPYVEIAKTSTTRWYPFVNFKNAFMDKPLPDKAIDIILKFMPRANEQSHIFIACLGGKNDKINPKYTAFVHRNMLGWLHINCQWEDQLQQKENVSWVTEFYGSLLPYLSDHVYQNTPDISLKNYLYHYYGENLRRLISIKKKYDPQNIFHHPQSIPLKLK